jgi:hypothetical protein
MTEDCLLRRQSLRNPCISKPEIPNEKTDPIKTHFQRLQKCDPEKALSSMNCEENEGPKLMTVSLDLSAGCCLVFNLKCLQRRVSSLRHIDKHDIVHVWLCLIVRMRELEFYIVKVTTGTIDARTRVVAKKLAATTANEEHPQSDRRGKWNYPETNVFLVTYIITSSYLSKQRCKRCT